MSQQINQSQEIKQFRSAIFELETLNVEERTIEISFSDEEPVLRSEGYEILDHDVSSVDLDRLNAGAGLFLDHDTSIRSQVGQVIRAWIDVAARKGRALIRFGRATLADDVWKNIEAQVFPGVSVGYVILRTQPQSGNTFRVISWLPYEISLVGVPASTNVGFGRSLENDISNKTQSDESRERENTDIENSIQSIKDKKDIFMEEVQEVRSAPVDTTKLINQERKRVADINQLASDFTHIGEIRSMADKAINEGSEVSDFQAQVLTRMKSHQTQSPAFYGSTPVVTDNVEADPKKGFRHFAEFTSSLVSIARRNGINSEIQKRAAPSVFANTNTGADGGFAIPPGFANEILDLGTDETSLLPLTRNTPVTGNNMTFPYNTKQPWSAGVQAYWRQEAAEATQSKAAVDRLQLSLNPLTALCPATDEMLSDQSAMASFLMTNMGRAVNWKINDAILNGTGSDQPLGILQSNGTVEIAKENSQAADSIVSKNILNLYARVFQNGNLVWLVNPDAFPEIAALTLGDRPMWSDNFKDMPNGALLGKQIILTDACQTLGDVGDIVLANMSGYYTISKSEGAQFAESMHLWFDQSITAFRLAFRIDGSPLIQDAITPAKGSNKRGFFATIAARA